MIGVFCLLGYISLQNIQEIAVMFPNGKFQLRLVDKYNFAGENCTGQTPTTAIIATSYDDFHPIHF